MKKYNVSFILIIIFLSFLILSCVTPGAVQAESETELPSIYEKYKERFEKIVIGMEYSVFAGIFPESYKVGQSDHHVAYEFKDTQIYYTSHDKNIGILWTGSIKTREYTQTIWFYFKDTKLVKWGEPKNWPQ